MQPIDLANLVPHEILALGLGSNQGDSATILTRAVGCLRALLGTLWVAPLYRSAAVSPIPQPSFLNTVVVAKLGAEGAPRLEPEEILAAAQALEIAAGRRPGPRWGPRPLDVDLLIYGDQLSSRAELTLPHPEMRRRAFVLAPLADLVPHLSLAPDGSPVEEVLEQLEGGPWVERIGWPGGPP